MTITNKDTKKSEVLFSLSTALKDFESTVSSDVDMYTTLSEALASHGFQSIMFNVDKKKEIATIITVNLFSDQENTLLLGKECDIPIYDSVTLIACDQWLSQYVSDSALSQYTPHGVIFPLNNGLLVVVSDKITEDVLPAFSVFNDLVTSFILLLEQLKQAKEQKRFSERIIQKVQDGISMENADGVITFVNLKLLEMVGYTEKEVIGRHYTALVHPDSLPQVKETKKRHLDTSQYEAFMQHKSGTRVPVIVTSTPLLENGNLKGNVTVVSGRSAQKKETARTFKEFNEKVVHSLHEALMIEDTEGVITFVNPMTEALFEREKGDIMGHHWQEFVAPACIAAMKEESLKRKQGISGRYEAALMTKDGRKIPVMVCAAPLFEGDQFTGVISIWVDLTMVKEKEKEIRRKNEDLRLLSKINQALNKGTDLKTMLTMAIQEVQHIFDVRLAAIMVLEEDKCIRSEPVAVFPDALSLCGSSFHMGEESVLKKVINEKEGYIASDVENVFKGILIPEMAAKLQEELQVTSVIVLPLIVEEEVIGIMVMGSQTVDQTDFDRLKSLSKHLALALDHAHLDEIVQKTSQELQTHLSEQTSLRELVETLYTVKTQKEVIDSVAEGLKNLGYPYYSIAVKEPDAPYVNIVQIQPDNTVDTVKKIVKNDKNCLERIKIPEECLEKLQKRTALVTNNITLEKEKNVIFLPLEDVIQMWVGYKDVPAVIKALRVQSLMCIPFQIETQFMGAFVVGSTGVLTHHDFVVLQTVGHITGEALGKLQYSKMIEKKSQDLEFSNRQLQLLQEMSNALNSTMDLGELLRILVTGIRSVFGYYTPSVYLLSDDKEYLLVKEFDINSKLLDGITKLVGFSLEKYKIPLFEGSLLKKVIDTGEPLITDDIPRFLKDYTEKESLRRLADALYRLGKVDWVAALPLMAADEPVGMVVFGSEHHIEVEDLKALSGFLDQAVLAVYKARMYEQLREASQMKTEFIDIASHELRTPLTSINLYLEMIQMDRYGELSPELKEKIGLLQANAEKLQEIIEKTLISSKIQKKGFELKKEEISLRELAQNVRAELRPTWEVREQKIEIRGPYKLPLVKGDRDALWKVITALVENAIKYSPEGAKITVKIYDRKNCVEVAVMDEGAGITKMIAICNW